MEKQVMPPGGWLVRCDSCDPSRCRVLGGLDSEEQFVYSEYSPVCCSAQHAGVIVSYF